MPAYALLIGIDKYEDDEITELRFASRDVKEFRDKLIKLLGYPEDNIYLYTHEKSHHADHLSVIKQFSLLSRKMKPEDSFIFYFSGHGVENETGVHLLTTDTDTYSKLLLGQSSIPLKALMNEMSCSRVLNRIFIIDACRNNPVTKSKGGTAPGLSDKFAKEIIMVANAGEKFSGTPRIGTLFSTSRGYRSFERSKLQHGLFSYFLLEGMEELMSLKGEIPLTDLTELVNKRMSSWCRVHFEDGIDQSPWLSMEGNIPKLIPMKKKPLKMIPSLHPSSIRHHSRLSVEDLLETGVLEEYLENGGKLKGKDFSDLLNDLRNNYQLDKPSHLKTLLEEVKTRIRQESLARLLDEAHSLNKKEAYDKALESLNKLLELDSRHREALDLKSRIINEKKHQESLARLLDEARSLNKKGAYDKALETLNKLLEFDSRHREALALKSKVLELQRQEEITRLLDEARSLNKKGAYDKALESLNKLLELDSRHREALDLKSRIINEKKHQESPARLLERAQSYYRNTNYYQAIAIIRELLKIDNCHNEGFLLKKRIEFLIDIGIKMIYIPGGVFEMGDLFGDGDYDELPVHRVEINDFYFAETPVTFFQYDRYCEETGALKPDDCGWGREEHPVINVNWYDAVKFCGWLSEKTGLKFRLPTEAEWEYAARSGGKREKWAGTNNKEDMKDYAWYNINSGDLFLSENGDLYEMSENISGSHAVKRKLPNGLGLYDMNGNVWEWCQDIYDKNFYKRSLRQNPQGPEKGTLQVIRGGSWYSKVNSLRCSNRDHDHPLNVFNYIGFRCIQTF